MKEKYARYLLKKNRDDYNKIAKIFDEKRHYIPSDFMVLEKHIQEREKILDLGCGNGRLKEIVKDKADYYGVDVSEKMIRIAQRRYPDAKFFVNEFLFLPFENSFFDKVFCLAVFHHIPSLKFRNFFLKEIKRVLKPRGELILTVWDLRDSKKARQLLFKYTLLKLIGKTGLDWGDIFYPWRDSQGKVLAQRYIHVFSEKELEGLILNAGFILKEKGTLKRSKKGKNLFFVAQKSKKSS